MAWSHPQGLRVGKEPQKVAVLTQRSLSCFAEIHQSLDHEERDGGNYKECPAKDAYGLICSRCGLAGMRTIEAVALPSAQAMLGSGPLQGGEAGVEALLSSIPARQGPCVRPPCLTQEG